MVINYFGAEKILNIGAHQIQFIVFQITITQEYTQNYEWKLLQI
jgi:hypothetical protein